MAAAKNFGEFYQTDLAQQLLPFENLRKKVARSGFIGFGLAFLAIVFFAIVQTRGSQVFFVFFFIFLLAAIIFTVIYHNCWVKKPMVQIKHSESVQPRIY